MLNTDTPANGCKPAPQDDCCDPQNAGEAPGTSGCMG